MQHPKTTIQDDGMFTWTFKMAAILVKVSLSDLSNRLYIDAIFKKIFVIPVGMRPPQISVRGYFYPFQIEVGGTN